jgi:hypothetical protein
MRGFLTTYSVDWGGIIHMASIPQTLTPNVKDECTMLFESILFGSYRKKKEQDTLWENKAFEVLKDYLEENHQKSFADAKGTTQAVLDQNLKKALESLYQCAKVYKKELIPRQAAQYCYRGMGLPVAVFKKHASKFKTPDKEGIVTASTQYNSRRVVESWTTDFMTALRFTYGPRNYMKWKTFNRAQVFKEWHEIADMMGAGKEPIEYIPCIWKIKVGSRNCIFNPDFSDQLSSWRQREVLRFTDDAAPCHIITHQKFLRLVNK